MRSIYKDDYHLGKESNRNTLRWKIIDMWYSCCSK